MPAAKDADKAVDQTTDQATEAEAMELPVNPDQKTVILHNPIMRGAIKITEVGLRKPLAGDLRGIKLVNVIEMDTAAIGEVVPRITTTGMTKAEFFSLDLSDAIQITTAVGEFMSPNANTQTA